MRSSKTSHQTKNIKLFPKIFENKTGENTINTENVKNFMCSMQPNQRFKLGIESKPG